MVLTTLFPRWRQGQVTVLAVPTSTPAPPAAAPPPTQEQRPVAAISNHTPLDGGTGQAQVAGSAPWV